jgi:hypothetical protein
MYSGFIVEEAPVEISTIHATLHPAGSLPRIDRQRPRQDQAPPNLLWSQKAARSLPRSF